MDIMKYFHSEFDNPPLSQKIVTYFNFAFLLVSQLIISALRKIFLPRKYRLKKDSQLIVNHAREQYPALIESDDLAGIKHELDTNYYPTLTSFQQLYNIGALSRMKACFHKEIFSHPGRVVQLKQGYKLNFCSYNYLGFAGVDFSDKLTEVVQKYGLSRNDHYDLLQTLESTISNLLDHEDTAIYPMGFDTNALGIPQIITPKDLIISDKLNHASIVTGCKRSGAKIKLFSHELSALEKVLHEVNFDQFESVWVVVEGLYSMEGSIVDLPRLIALKQKFGFKLYLDEAHSIGALGSSGAGVCDHFNIPHSQVDVLMGTFTKSFSSVGGYISANSEQIRSVRKRFFEFPIITPIAVAQVIFSLQSLTATRLSTLRTNSIFLRTQLKKLKFTVYGDDSSPVVPVLFYNCAKMKFIQDYLLKRNVAAVVVGFPAVPLVSGRIRFCVSAGHQLADLEYLVECMRGLSQVVGMRFE